MLIFIPALNLKLSVALCAPIIANYLLQPEAACAGLPSQIKHCYSPDRAVKCTKNSPQIPWIFRAVSVCGSDFWLSFRSEWEHSGSGCVWLIDRVKTFVCSWPWTHASDMDLIWQLFNIELSRKRDHAVAGSEIWDASSSAPYQKYRRKVSSCSPPPGPRRILASSQQTPLFSGQTYLIRWSRFCRFVQLLPAAVFRRIWGIKSRRQELKQRCSSSSVLYY